MDKERKELLEARLESLYVQVGQAAEDQDWKRFAELADAAERLEAYIESHAGGKKGGK